MRLLQNVGVSRTYSNVGIGDATRAPSYGAAITDFIGSRYGALHILEPVLVGAPEAMLVIGNSPSFQARWAREHGLKYKSLSDVLLAQIEDARTEVFYNCDPLSFGDDFLRRLPGSVRRTIAWSAAPHGSARFFGHDVIVCNFPNILAAYAAQGAVTRLLYPAYDPVMADYEQPDREVDLVFAGTYSRHHRSRNVMLEAMALLAGEFSIRLLVQPSRMTRLAEGLGWLAPPLAQHRRSRALRRASEAPLYGRDLYRLLGRSKIVLNGAIGMAGGDRGNLRVWEATGCGGMLLSDDGLYPEGFANRVTMATYRNLDELVATVRAMLGDDGERRAIAKRGNDLIRTIYGKDRQWRDFQDICG